MAGRAPHLGGRLTALLMRRKRFRRRNGPV
jgi:hypothetical protein